MNAVFKKFHFFLETVLRHHVHLKSNRYTKMQASLLNSTEIAILERLSRLHPRILQILMYIVLCEYLRLTSKNYNTYEVYSNNNSK